MELLFSPEFSKRRDPAVSGDGMKTVGPWTALAPWTMTSMRSSMFVRGSEATQRSPQAGSTCEV